MTNLEKYKEAFAEGLEISTEGIETLVFEGIPEWDSVGHMGLISALEDTFGIMFETDDIIELNSFEKGIETLKKYGVEF